MNRQEIYKEMEEMFGLVPSFFKLVPDSSLELEWQLFKRVQFEPGPVPNKYHQRGRTVSSSRESAARPWIGSAPRWMRTTRRPCF